MKAQTFKTVEQPDEEPLGEGHSDTLIEQNASTATKSSLSLIAPSPSAFYSTNIEATHTVGLTNPTKKPPTGPPRNYCSRRACIPTNRMNELRRKAHEAAMHQRTFTIRGGGFSSIRTALLERGWVEKLDAHRKQPPSGVCQVTFDDLAIGLPMRKPGENRRQYATKCERNILSRFLEHMPIDFLWTNRKERCDFVDQAKNPGMTINKFHRAPFTTKEGLCSQLKEFHWHYETGIAELYFPRCFNAWCPEELNEFVENFKLTASIAFVSCLISRYQEGGLEAAISSKGEIPISAVDFAYKRCTEYLDACQHNDIDVVEDVPRTGELDWDVFLHQHHVMLNEGGKICADRQENIERIITRGVQVIEGVRQFWPQFSLDGHQNLWIVKPANNCRGRGIQLIDNLKRILDIVNPPTASKSRFVVQKYIERPLIIHNTKFDIRQWFLVTSVQPLIVWMYKESYLRFSSQEYSLSNHHESVHLTNHAVQKKYTNGERDRRLPSENMWDCYSFQAYLRQIGRADMWLHRIYPGMRKAIVGTMLASQENMDRRPNTFELFGADFMVTEDFHPWLIEINSSPDLGATTSVTARMCPQCLEDVIKVVIDRRRDPKANVGNFELVYRQVIPPTIAYMGLNLSIKGKKIMPKISLPNGAQQQRKERILPVTNVCPKKPASLVPITSNGRRPMPMFNSNEYLEKCVNDTPSSTSLLSRQVSPSLAKPRQVCHLAKPDPNRLMVPPIDCQILRRSLTTLPKICTENKRHRSCSPRLSTSATTPKVENQLRCEVKKYGLSGYKKSDLRLEAPSLKIQYKELKKCKEKNELDLLKLLNSPCNSSQRSKPGFYLGTMILCPTRTRAKQADICPIFSVKLANDLNTSKEISVPNNTLQGIIGQRLPTCKSSRPLPTEPMEGLSIET